MPACPLRAKEPWKHEDRWDDCGIAKARFLLHLAEKRAKSVTERSDHCGMPVLEQRAAARHRTAGTAAEPDAAGQAKARRKAMR